MLKMIHLAVATSLLLTGCENNVVDKTDDQYSQILKQEPKWVKLNDGGNFLDSSIDKKIPFMRVKSEHSRPGVQSTTENVYRLDCENHRAASYYTKLILTEKSDIDRRDRRDGYVEYNFSQNSEEYRYNPTQPNSVNRLWRSFPNNDNIFTEECQSRGLKIDPSKVHNTELSGWTFNEALSMMNNEVTYINTAQLNALKKNGSGDMTSKSFNQYTYTSNTSTEQSFKIDCKANTINLLKVTMRNYDYEFAPAADQSQFYSQRIYDTKPVKLNTKSQKMKEFIKTLCV